MSSEIQSFIAHSDTVSRCGVFCSFINATECCKTEGIVDVFQVVKALRIQKPGSVLTVVSISDLYVHDQHELPVDLQASFIQLYRLQQSTLYSGNIRLVSIILLIWVITNTTFSAFSLWLWGSHLNCYLFLQEQYRFIFDLMLLFLESFNIYSNFK